VLEATAGELPEILASEGWVQAAVEDEATPDAVVAVVMEKKLGRKAVLWSSDGSANERAYEAGYGVVRAQSLSPAERERYAGVGLQHASERFGVDKEEVIIQGNERMLDVKAYAIWLGKQLLGHDIVVSFYRSGAQVDADYSAARDSRSRPSGHLRFNVSRIPDEWWNDPPHERHTELIIHELAHHALSERPHSGAYIRELAALGAKATHLAMERSGQFWWKSPWRPSWPPSA
jgi:hypothetical protein